jgi:hypothetical protein
MCLPIQPIDATQALIRSAGVSKFKVFLGLAFRSGPPCLSGSCALTAASFVAYVDAPYPPFSRPHGPE